MPLVSLCPAGKTCAEEKMASSVDKCNIHGEEQMQEGKASSGWGNYRVLDGGSGI